VLRHGRAKVAVGIADLKSIIGNAKTPWTVGNGSGRLGVDVASPEYVTEDGVAVPHDFFG
jgi:hypothetical protein